MSQENVVFKVKFQPIEDPQYLAVKKKYPSFPDLVRSSVGNFVLTPRYAENAEKIYNFQVRPDDAWIVTFPKCGTTWTQELIWLVMNDYDFEKAKSITLDIRFPFLELPFLPPEEFLGSYLASDSEIYDAYVPLDDVIKLPFSRFIKTHLPFFLLPPKLLDTAKVVYVARNPKDVIVSFYYHHKLFKLLKKNEMGIGEFADLVIHNHVMYGSFFDHVLEAWNKREHQNLLFLFYEDLTADLEGQIRKISKFLDKPVNEEKLPKLLEHLSFKQLSKNPSVNNERGKQMGFMSPEENFLRKGETGDWKNHFDSELNAKIQAWIEESLKNTDLKLFL